MYSFTQQQAMESFVSAKIDQATQKLREEIKNLVSSSSNPTSSIRPEASNSARQGSGRGQSNGGGSITIPQASPVFNYIIDGPNEDDPKSAIAAEINLDSPNLYVLGLQDQELKWVLGGEGSSFPHPWKITLRRVGETLPPEYEYKVEPNSKIYLGTGTFDGATVNGLNEWNEASNGYILVSGEVENSEVASFDIVEDGDGTLERAEYDTNNLQTFTRTRIGYLYTSNGRMNVLQLAFSDMTAITTCYDAKPTICLVQT